jgi:hypothetical protein
MGLFKKKNKVQPNLPAELPAMPDLPTIDEPPMALQPNTNFSADLPELPSLDIPQVPMMQSASEMPAVPNPESDTSFPEPHVDALDTADPQDAFLTEQEYAPFPAEPRETAPQGDTLGDFHISDEELEGLNFDEPMQPAVQQPAFVSVPQEIVPEIYEPVQEVAEIPEPPMFDDTEGPLFVTTKNFRTVIGMLDDSTKQLENELHVGSEVLNNNGLQLKSLEHLHTEFMQMYKKLNTVDEILFERNL